MATNNFAPVLFYNKANGNPYIKFEITKFSSLLAYVSTCNESEELYVLLQINGSITFHRYTVNFILTNLEFLQKYFYCCFTSLSHSDLRLSYNQVILAIDAFEDSQENTRVFSPELLKGIEDAVIERHLRSVSEEYIQLYITLTQHKPPFLLFDLKKSFKLNSNYYLNLKIYNITIFEKTVLAINSTHYASFMPF